MFIALSLISMLGFVFHMHLLQPISREVNAWTLGAYRGIVLMVLMAPLLLLAQPGSLHQLLTHWYIFLSLGVTGAFSLFCQFKAQELLPSSIFAVILGSNVIVTIFLSYLYLHEALSLWQYICIGVIVVGWTLLVTGRSADKQTSGTALRYSRKGVIWWVLRMTTVGAWTFALGYAAQTFDPAVTWYGVETSLGLTMIVIGLGRYLTGRRDARRVNWKNFRAIALCASTIVFGMGGVVLASSMGPISIVAAIAAASPVMNALLGSAFYKDRLTRKQRLIILVTTGAVIGLILW